MALRDELDAIVVEDNKRRAQVLSDEEAYQILLESMYESYIVKVIKNAVTEGKRYIEGEFPLSHYGVNVSESIPWSRLSDKSNIYIRVPGGEDPDCFRFQKLYVFNEPRFFKKGSVELTHLGERVYSDLKRLAQVDQVTLSSPIPQIGEDLIFGKLNYSATMRVKFCYRYR